MNTTKLRYALYRLVLLFWWGLFLLLGQTTAAQTCTGEVLNISTTAPSQTGNGGSWTVPAGGPYKIRITAKGAKGGNTDNMTVGGSGATMIGEFIVNSGQTIQAMAGSLGGNGTGGLGSAGGGGGSGAQIQNGNLLILAGGGGGAGYIFSGNGGVVQAGAGSGGASGGGTSDGGGGGGMLGSGGNGGSSGLGTPPTGGGAGFGAQGGNLRNCGSFSGGNGGGGFSGGGGGNCSLGGGGGGGYSGGNAGMGLSNGGGGGGGGGSYNLGSNQNNTAGANNAGGQVIIECLGTATYSATVTPIQPTCNQSGSISIDFTGDFNNNTSGGLEYAIVAGNSFTGTPTFADVTADPFNVTSGMGTTVGTYTVRTRLKYNPTLYVDKTYTLTRPCNCTFYVNTNATGANNGSSWADAFTSLQDALETACSGAEIWVAAGTYYPTADPSGNKTPADARTKAFVMKNGVAIYGGFNGTESQLTARNWRSNATVLSGNIGNTGVDTDNSYRVINNTFTSGSPLNNTAILDGFIVEKGYADGGFPFNLGGGMWNTHASPTVRHCVFRNNYAVSGGGMFNDNSQATIINSLFVNNTGTTTGAGLSNGGGTDQVKVVNCTFYGNTGPITIYNEKSATTVSNSIIWANGGGISGGTVTYSNVQGGVTGTGNSRLDPRFVNAAGGDFRLQQCSPAIDKGTNTNAPTTDFEGNARPFNATGVSNTDIGAYEYQSTYDICSACVNITGGIIYVNASSLGTNNGSSWTNAFTDLQSALSLARSYPSCVSQIWVAKGTYKPTSGTDRAISFEMVNGVAIYGGFAGGETQLSARNWVANKTILSGDIGTIDDNGDNSFNVILNNNNGLDNSAILNGFTISGGNANGVNNNNSGGGMNNIGSSPHILNCKFLNNSAIYVGGGINNSSASPLIANCVFFGNSAGADGGAIGNLFATSTIINCSFSDNTSPITTVTSINTSSIIVTNCAFWNNFQIADVSSSPSSRVSISYCISPQTYGGLGNLTANPLFVDAANGDFRLQACSPAINAGDAATTSAMVGLVDFAGNPRFYADGRIDMGAYEYQSSLPTAITPTVGTSNPTTCGGSNGNITLGGFLNNTTYSVAYKKNDTAISAANFTSDGSGVITLTSLGAGNYTDIVATYGACVSNAATASLQDPAKPAITLSTIPAICAGASSFTIPYSNATGSPNKYSISETGITAVSDGDLSNPITVALSSPASGSSIPFELKVKNATTNCESNTLTGSVTVNPVSVGGTVSSAQTICSGTSPADLSLSGQTGNVVKWQKSSDANFSNAVDIASTATLTTLPSALIGNLTANTYFRAVVQSGVCSEAVSSSVLITVNPVSVGGVVSSAQTICSGTSPLDVSLSGQTGNVVKWQKSSDANFSTPVDIASTATLTT
ncbi:choice-of-anchor Q domain-containing protein, partial [Runella limosa]|uniref:choice-of-anchor Q domain-containing protein n=1 Tax=Runella limosa TaxID=370978 RepID=UPI00286EB24C